MNWLIEMLRWTVLVEFLIVFVAFKNFRQPTEEVV